MQKTVFFTFLSCFTLLVLRGWERLTRAQVWAEDGSICLGPATALGLRSFIVTVGQVPYLIQHTFAHLALLISPLDYLPHTIFVLVTLFTAGIFSSFSSSPFRWFIASDRTRALVCFLFCLTPGLMEVLGNFANLASILTLWLVLIVLQDPKKPFGIFEAVAIAFCTFSMGTFVILIPAFLFRFGYRYYFYKVRPNLPEGTVLLLFAIAISLLLRIKTPAQMTLFQALSEVPTVLVPYLFRGLFFQPWFGDIATSALSHPGIKFWQGLAAVFFLILFLISIWRNRAKASLQFYLVVLSFLSTWPILGWMSRALSLPRFLGNPLSFWADRYAFPLGYMSVLLWVLLLQWLPTGRLRQLGFGLFVFVAVFLNSYRFFIPPYTERPVWQSAVPQIKAAKAAGERNEVFIPGVPESFDWKYSILPRTPTLH